LKQKKEKLNKKQEVYYVGGAREVVRQQEQVLL